MLFYRLCDDKVGWVGMGLDQHHHAGQIARCLRKKTRIADFVRRNASPQGAENRWIEAGFQGLQCGMLGAMNC